MNTPAQHIPSAQEVRHSLCSQLIGAGLKTGAEIVGNAKTIEAYIFGADTQTNAKTQTTGAAQSKQTKSEEPKTEAVVEQSNAEAEVATGEEQSQYTMDDVKAILLRVAKRDRDALKKILDAVNAPNLPAIDPCAYPQVMKLAEEFEAANA